METLASGYSALAADPLALTGVLLLLFVLIWAGYTRLVR
jgi:hypothetical protein